MTPIFVYECKQCKVTKEKFSHVDSFKNIPCCPKCNNKMARVLQPHTVVFKGGKP